VLQVADDGVGGAQADGDSGLAGLVDRVEALGGSLSVDSPAGGGTCVTASVPLA
jgi:signal transduction histidine kinase